MSASPGHRFRPAVLDYRAFLDFDGLAFDAPRTPKSLDREPPVASRKPSAAKPRFNISRTAEARLGMRLLNLKLSTASNSSSVNMICRRSPRTSSPIVTSLEEGKD